MKNKPGEYKNFTDLVDKVLTVSHGEIKATLDAEKRAKKRKKSKKSSASREAV
jgi:hypothetical protein